MNANTLVVWVEDETRYIRDLVAELNDRGVEVEVIGTANQLVRQLESVLNRANLIILDLWLPVGSTDSSARDRSVPSSLFGSRNNTKRGIWMCEQIQEAKRNARSNVPVLVLSGNLDVDSLDELKRAGISESYLFKKPADFDEFTQRVVELVSVKQ